MDTTHGGAVHSEDTPESLLDRLVAIDPADAPQVAEALAGVLSHDLDGSPEGSR